MKNQKTSFVIDKDIFIHLMTSSYKEGCKAGKELSSSECSTEAVTQFYHGLSDMLKEPATTVMH